MATAKVRVLLILAACGCASAYEGIAGSCNGVFSGDHLPNEVTDLAGGYQILMRDERLDGTLRTVSVTVKHGREKYIGFLVKSFDIQTGEPLGEWSDLPVRTAHFEGCIDKLTAVSHQIGFRATASQPLKLTLSWPKSKEIGIVAWLVAEETRWYEVTASSAGTIGTIPIACPATRVVPAAVIISFAPIVVLILATLATRMAPSLEKVLNQKVPLGGFKLPDRYYSSKHEWMLLRTLSFDIWPETISATLGEILSYVIFYGCQIAALVLVTLRISEQAKNQTAGYPGDDVELPNPFDAIIGRAIGRVLQYNFGMTILFPTRHSIWPSLVGVSFERCIKYHRIVGRWTYFLMVLHFLLLLGIYGWGDSFTTRLSCFGFGNLWGTLSFFGITAVMVTSLEPVRRLQWELFYYSHWLSVLGLVAASFHVTDTWHYMVPGGALMTLDMLLRFFSWASSSKVRTAKVLDGDVVKLEIECPGFLKSIVKKGAWGIGDYCYMHCSDVNPNPFDLHPFSISGLLHGETPAVPIASTELQPAVVFSTAPPLTTVAAVPAMPAVPQMEPQGAAAEEVRMEEIAGDSIFQGLTFHIKSMGPNTWSDRLVQAVQAKGSKLRVRLEGPYGHMGVRLETYETVVCVAGGIGFTPMAPLLEMALNPERRKEHLPKLHTIHVVWAVQSAKHLSWFEGLLQEVDRASGAIKPVALPDEKVGSSADGDVPDMEKGGVQVAKRPLSPSTAAPSFHLHLHVTRGAEGYATLPTIKGRPDLTALFERISAEGGDAKAAMLACGPRPLVEEAMSVANRFGCDCHSETFLL